jgi:hypothetical protein
VTGWPTVYLIDHEGVIVRQIGMSKADDDLIKEKVRQAESARDKGVGDAK